MSNIREVDALVHVVRCYENSSNIPLEDIEAIDLELIVADLESIEKRIRAIEKQTRNTSTQIKTEAEILKKIKEGMENGQPARNAGLLPDEIKIIKSMGLLTLKPVIYCANIAESDIGKDKEKLPFIRDIKQYAQREKSEALTVCAKIEEEISQLESEDKELRQYHLVHL